MRSLTLLAFIATTFTAAQAHAQNLSATYPGTYSVELNKTKIVRLPQAASSVLIGNPDIADVSVHSLDTLFVVGRGYGETNLIVLDRNGQEILDVDVTVVDNLPQHGVRLYNAKSRETYSCLPYCQPSPILGDNPGFIGANSNTQAAISTSTTLSNTSSEPNPAPSAGDNLAGGNDTQNISNTDDLN